MLIIRYRVVPVVSPGAGVLEIKNQYDFTVRKLKPMAEDEKAAWTSKSAKFKRGLNVI